MSSVDIKISDGISPELARMAKSVQDRKPILRAMGAELMSWTKRAFNDVSKRPVAWPPVKHSGAPLKRHGVLWHSIAVTNVSNDAVTVSTDRPYAQFHQLGTKGPYAIKPKSKRALMWPGAAHPMKAVMHPGLPARPFFPFSAGGTMMSSAAQAIERVGMAALRRLLRVRG